jgi:putative inorganic carbon (hco3(-)) transporter
MPDKFILPYKFTFAIFLFFLSFISLGAILNELWIFFIPLFIVVLYYYLESIDLILPLIIISVPFSLELMIPGIKSYLQFPSEPLIIVTLILWLFYYLIDRNKTILINDTKIIIGMLSVFILFILLSVLTSSDLTLSIKLFLNTSWYIASCVLFVIWNVRSRKRLEQMLIMLLIGGFIITVYTLIRHSSVGFSFSLVNKTMRPFFNEHGSYAAHLSIVLGVAIGMIFGLKNEWFKKTLISICCLILVIGIILSYTRAAWLGMVIMLSFIFVVKIKDLISLKFFMIIVVGGIIILFVGINENVKATTEKTALSITDVQKDVSNLERFNRWIAAINMIKAHPINGIGYGTFPKMYEKYKDKRFLTYDSYKYMGVHNDYLQYFAEAGIFALFAWIVFIITLLYKGLKYYFRSDDKFEKNLILGCMGAVLSYVVHAFFNDFLNIDKVAVPFWLAIGIILLIINSSMIESNRKYLSISYSSEEQ